jgi:gluconate 2-dehydrogenase gamma chain
MKLNRRQFVYSLAAMAAAPPRPLQAAIQSPGSASPSLTAAEKTALGHLCQQIIPADAFPGARDLGVVDFIERTLQEAHPDWIVVYRAGLRSTDLSSQHMHGRPFADLPFAQQKELLEKMESDDLPQLEWSGVAGSDFFAMVRDHTMQGYYSHPRWGGNKDKAAWRMIGYDDWWA